MYSEIYEIFCINLCTKNLGKNFVLFGMTHFVVHLMSLLPSCVPNISSFSFRHRSLQDTVAKLVEQQEKERESYRLKFMENHKQSQETIDHLQRKCQCLTKL